MRGDSGVVVVKVHVTVSLVVMVIVLVALLVMSLVGERGVDDGGSFTSCAVDRLGCVDLL